MSVDLREDGKILVITLTGKLSKEDYEHFIPEVERLIKQHGKLRMLVEMHDFHGWTAGALWQDIKLDLKHFRDIDRLALVGEKAWEHGMGVFCKPFTTAAIRYFDRSKAHQAEAWIHADIVVAKRSGALPGPFATTERDTPMHATSELREWFLDWLDGGNGEFDHEAVAKLTELHSCIDELPAGYCQHGRLRLPFGVSYGVAAQKLLGKND